MQNPWYKIKRFFQKETINETINETRCASWGHTFEKLHNPAKRKCSTCDREEWLFSKPYPQVGEPKYFWKDMTIKPLEVDK